MRIAIVDDEAIELMTTESYFRRQLADLYPEEEASLHVDTFTRAEDLIGVFEPGSYDLIMLDIFMATMNGMQAAQLIRNKDSEVSLVFLTSSEEFLLEGYRVFAAGYFLKPLAEHGEDFRCTLAHIFPQIQERQKELSVRTGSLQFSVPYKNICYADINWKHQLSLHLTDSTLILTMAYEEISVPLLEDSRFLECHHRILVNMDMIVSMGKNTFTLKQGDHIPISQRKQKEAKSKYMQYFAHR